jgi:hypothetical protein
MRGTAAWPGRGQKIVAVGSGSGKPNAGTGGATSTATLASLSPASVPHGVQPVAVTATGTGFKNGIGIYVDGKAYITTYLSTTQAKAVIPPGAAGSRQITVRNPGEVATAARALTIT